MPLRDVSEFIGPEADLAFEAFQQQMIPYLINNLAEELFEPGREKDLFVALNDAFLDRLDHDGTALPQEVKFKLLMDITSLMPAFESISDADKSTLMKWVFDRRETKPENPSTP